MKREAFSDALGKRRGEHSAEERVRGEGMEALKRGSNKAWDGVKESGRKRGGRYGKRLEKRWESIEESIEESAEESMLGA